MTAAHDHAHELRTCRTLPDHRSRRTSEQQTIARHSTTETREIDALVDKTRRSIDLLREYRTALISAAVTGQIDIPGTETAEDVA